jgi:hypothetical protein
VNHSKDSSARLRARESAIEMEKGVLPMSTRWYIKSVQFAGYVGNKKQLEYPEILPSIINDHGFN